MIAGTRTNLMIVASMRIAVASPRPNILMRGSSSKTKPPKTAIMISAAAVMTRAVPAMPWITAARLSPVRR